MTISSASSASSASPAAKTGVRHTTAILAIILVSYFMILLDNSIIFTALPKIHAAMRFSPAGLAWVQDAYALAFGGLLLLGARAGDLMGRRRVFVFGLAVFALASLLVGLAPAGWWLITARGVQGVGAAIVAPSSLSLLTASFNGGRERAKAVALYGATAGIGASLGLVIGGALADWVSWRAGFFVNVPVGAAMIVLAPRFLPESTRSRGRFDLTGAVSATAGIGALVYGIIHSAGSGWGTAATVIPLLAGAVLIAALVLAESRAAEPIMPLRLFASRVVAMPMILIGAGQGLAFAPLTSAGIAGIGARDAGAASGLVNTLHQLGMALGLSVLVAVSASSGHGLTSAAAVLTAHVHTALTAGTVLLAASLLAVLGLIVPAHLRSRSPRPATPQPEPGTIREPAPMMTSA